MVAELQGLDDCVLLPSSTVFGYHDHNFLTIAERCAVHPGSSDGGGVRERLWRVRARQVVLAQGSLERPLVFCNNDRPGVMLASAVSTYVERYAVLPGRRAVVFTNNDSAYRAAISLAGAGAEVAAVVDSRFGGGGRTGAAGELGARVQALGIPVLAGHVVSDVAGRHRVTGVGIARWNGDNWGSVRSTIRMDCDLVAVSGGWSPAVHLHSQAGGRLAWDESRLCFVPAEARQVHVSAGAGNGKWSLGECLADGLRAGAEAVSKLGLKAAAVRAPVTDADAEEKPIEALWRVPAARDADRCPRQFVDFQNDTTVADIRLAAREGYRNVEHVKRYTALGFGTDQGKLGNINGMAVLADVLGKAIPEVGTTTFRPAYTPVSFGVCAGESVGELYDPVRTTAIHEWHEAAGAPMENVGQWLRPWYFPRDGEDLNAAVARECLAVRESLGVMDASTLGKIDACGPDVVEFLERIYTHNVGRMEVGRCAYGVIPGEDGMLMDDGVMARTGERRFYLTTTTGGAASVLDWMEKWLQTEWPELEVYLTLAHRPLFDDRGGRPQQPQPVGKAGLRYPAGQGELSVHDHEAGGAGGHAGDVVPGELFRRAGVRDQHRQQQRAGHVARDHGGRRRIRHHAIRDGNHACAPRREGLHHRGSGHRRLGDARGPRHELAAVQGKGLSRQTFATAARLPARRPQAMGGPAVARTAGPCCRKGAQLIGDTGRPADMCGHVTSSYFSACLGHPIALALVAGGRQRKGETIYAARSGRDPLPVRIVSPVFYDPKGSRQHV